MNTDNIKIVSISRANFKNVRKIDKTNTRIATCKCCGLPIAVGEGECYGSSSNMNGNYFHFDCIKNGVAVGELVRGKYSKRCNNHRITATLHVKAEDVDAVWCNLVAEYGVASMKKGCLIHIVSPLYVSNNASSNLYELLTDLEVNVNVLVGSVEYTNVDAVTYKRLTDKKAPRY